MEEPGAGFGQLSVSTYQPRRPGSFPFGVNQIADGRAWTGPRWGCRAFAGWDPAAGKRTQRGAGSGPVRPAKLEGGSAPPGPVHAKGNRRKHAHERANGCADMLR